MQELRVISQAREQEARIGMQQAAFIGWQTALAFGGKKVGDFQTYLRRFGLADGPRASRRTLTIEEAQAARQRAEDEAAKVVAAFARRKVVRA